MIKNKLLFILIVCCFLSACQSKKTDSYIQLKKTSNVDSVLCYQIKMQNVKKIRIRMENKENEDFPLTLTGGIYRENTYDEGVLMFKLDKNIDNSILGILDTKEFDYHFNLSPSLNIDMTNGTVLTEVESKKITFNNYEQIFSYECDSQTYDVYIEAEFHQ